ncbi:MAG: type II secretion system minor pseudopilin GspK [Pseudomonadota bacterium]
MRVRKPATGVALIMVMLMLTMAVIIAAQVMERIEQDRTRTANTLALEQANAYLLSAEALGVRALAADLVADQQAGEEIDACTEQDWAVAIGPLPWDNGIFQVSVQDLQGRFNLNNLVASHDGERSIDRLQLERLKRLLKAVLPDTGGAEAADALAEEAGDWLDGNTLVDGLGGAEDTEYETWRTGNQPLGHISELRALRSATRELWQAADDKPLFSRYITVLPEGTRINVNTAPAEVLQALAPALGSTGADAIIRQREEKPFLSVDEVLAVQVVAAMPQAQRDELKAAIAVNSDYFQVTSQVAVADRTARLVSYVYRPRRDEAAQIIQRDLGALFVAPEGACNPGWNPPEKDGDDNNPQGGNPA